MPIERMNEPEINASLERTGKLDTPRVELRRLESSYKLIKSGLRAVNTRLDAMDPDDFDRGNLVDNRDKYAFARDNLVAEAMRNGYLDGVEDLARYSAAYEKGLVPLDRVRAGAIKKITTDRANELVRDFFGHRKILEQARLAAAPPTEYKPTLPPTEGPLTRAEVEASRTRTGDDVFDELNDQYDVLRKAEKALDDKRSVTKDPTTLGELDLAQAKLAKDKESLFSDAQAKGKLWDLTNPAHKAQVDRLVEAMMVGPSSPDWSAVEHFMTENGFRLGFLLNQKELKKQEIARELEARRAGEAADAADKARLEEMNHFKLPEAMIEAGQVTTAQIRVQSVRGMIPIDVLVPKQIDDQWKFLNDVLIRLERSTSENIDPEINADYQLAQEMLAALRSKAYRSHPENANEFNEDGERNPYYNIGEKLAYEFHARVKLHQSYYAFIRSDEIKQLGEIMSKFDYQDLNSLFGEDAYHTLEVDVPKAGGGTERIVTTDVMYMMGVLDMDDIGRNYVSKIGSGGIEPVREEAKNRMREQLVGTVRDFREIEDPIERAKAIEQARQDLENRIEVAFTQAERLWIMTGRILRFDPRHKGNLAGGPWSMRRVLEIIGRIEENEEKQNFFPELLFPKDDPSRQVDLDEGDFWGKKFVSMRFDYIKRSLGGSASAAATALENVRDLTGLDLKLDGESLSEESLLLIRDHMDLRRVKGTQINAKSFDTARPFNYWWVYNVEYQEGVRSELESDEGLLRNPTPEALWRLKGKLKYLSGKQWREQEKLVYNLAHFLQKENHARLHRPNWSLGELETFIEAAASRGLIKTSQMHHIMDELKKDASLYQRFMFDKKTKTIWNIMWGGLEGLLKGFFKGFKEGWKYAMKFK